MTDRLPPTETGEAILWQGRPSARIVYGPGEIVLAAGGVILLLYLLGGLFVVGISGTTGAGVALAIVGLAAGFMILGYPAISAYRRSQTRYTLTSVRALVSTNSGLNWTSYPVEDWTPLSLVGTKPPSVYYAQRVVMDWLQRWGEGRNQPVWRDVGFTHIANAEEVFGLMLDLTQTARAADGADHAPPGWENFLTAGETILWQGRPNPGVILRGTSLIMIVAGAIFLLFPAIILLASEDTISGHSAVVAFPFVAFGLTAVFVVPQFGAYLRRNSWYALTDRRAVIAARLFRQRSLDSYTVEQWTHLVLKNTRPPSVHFRSEQTRTGNSTRYRNIGFHYIEEAEHVHTMMQRLRDDS